LNPLGCCWLHFVKYRVDYDLKQISI
jgi:hypothetical protein